MLWFSVGWFRGITKRAHTFCTTPGFHQWKGHLECACLPQNEQFDFVLLLPAQFLCGLCGGGGGGGGWPVISQIVLDRKTRLGVLKIMLHSLF